MLLRRANRAKELGAYRRQLKKGLGKWQNRDAAQAFNGWAVFAALRRRRKRLLARGAKGMTPLGRAFNSWAHKSRGMRQRRDSLRKGIARMTDPQAKAFGTWKLMAHARRDAIAVLRRGGAALRSPELRWGFKVWRVAAFVAKRDEAARRRGGMGLAQPELLWAFNRFRAHRDAQRSFLKHNPFLKRAFNGWSSYAAEGRRQKLHKMVHGDEVHIREGHANDETPHTYCGVLNILRQDAHILRRICAHPAPGMHHLLRLSLRTLCACAVGESST